MQQSFRDTRGMTLCGARIWARWKLVGSPLYDLWEYIGPQQHMGHEVHRFTSYKPKHYPPVVMFMTMDQLTHNAANFRPFCVDTRGV